MRIVLKPNKNASTVFVAQFANGCILGGIVAADGRATLDINKVYFAAITQPYGEKSYKILIKIRIDRHLFTFCWQIIEVLLSNKSPAECFRDSYIRKRVWD